MAKDFFDDLYSVAEGQEALDQFRDRQEEGYEEDRQQRIQAQETAASEAAALASGAIGLTPMESDAYTEANQAELAKRRAELEKLRLEREERKRERQEQIAARKAEQDAERERRRQELEARRDEFNAQRGRQPSQQSEGSGNYVRQRMQQRREGYEQRRDQRELERLQSNRERGLYVSTADQAKLDRAANVTQFPDMLPIQVGTGKAFVRGTSVSIDGQVRPILSPQTALTEREWEKVLTDGTGAGAEKALELLDNTVEALSSVTSSPEAQQFAERYRSIQQQEEAVEANTALTAGEKKQAKKDLIRRKARMAVESRKFRDVGGLVERQEMRDFAEKNRRSEAARDREAALITDIQKKVDKASDKQFEQTGQAYSRSQRMALTQKLYQESIEQQQAIQSLLQNGTLPPDADMPVTGEGDLGIEDADGALVYYSDSNNQPMFRSTNDDFTSMPARRVNNKMYPAPRNDMEVKALPKGAVYVDPASPTSLTMKETGAPSPTQVFREEEEKRAVKAKEQLARISDNVLQNMIKDYAAKQEALSLMPDDLTLDDLRSGYGTGGLTSSQRAAALSDAPDVFTLEGQKAYQQKIQEQLVLADMAQQAAVQFENQKREEFAPYQNTRNNYEAFVSGEDDDRLLVRNGQGQVFEAYTVAARGSRFRGTPVPIFDDYQDLQRSGDEIFNSAYFNPVAGRIVPINIPSGNGLGPMTDAAFNMISDTLMTAYPGLIRNSLQAKEIMIRAAAHMGYDIPEIAGAPATPLEEAVTGQTTPVPGQA